MLSHYALEKVLKVQPPGHNKKLRKIFYVDFLNYSLPDIFRPPVRLPVSVRLTHEIDWEYGHNKYLNIQYKQLR